MGLLLVLRAFSSGATAMTGMEAISNAVPAFKPVEWRNARTTLSWMIALLVAMFAGIVVLVHLDGVVPVSNQTVLLQLAHLDFGSGPLYGYTQAATALILLLAANTAYNDFPRVMFLLARDRFAARRYLRMGDRRAFNHGIIALSLVAALVFATFGGKTASLIPLYAVGVFSRLYALPSGDGRSLVAAVRRRLAHQHHFHCRRLHLLGDRAPRRGQHQVHGGRLAGTRDRGRLDRLRSPGPAPLRVRRRRCGLESSPSWRSGTGGSGPYTTTRLRRALRPLPKVVVTSVRFHVSQPSRHSGAASANAFMDGAK